MTVLRTTLFRQTGLALSSALILALALPSTVFAQSSSHSHGGSVKDRGVLRVCADPNNLPFSAVDESGFENKMAEILAEELQVPVEYLWYPQRFGYIRGSLRYWDYETRRFRCDVLMGAPLDGQGLSTTSAYYHSTYALVYAKGRGLDHIEQATDLITMDPAARAGIRIGAYDQTPATAWLLRHGMRENLKGYILQDGDVSMTAGRIIKEHLAEGTLDAAIIWGPLAGYYAAQAPEDMVVLPMVSEHQIRFDYAISVGVRGGDNSLLRPLQRAIRDRRDDIQALLEEYNILTVDVEDPRFSQ